MYGGGSFGSFPIGSLIAVLEAALASERSSQVQGTEDITSERSSQVVGVTTVPTKLSYKILVLDENGDPLGEFETFRGLKFGKRLNNYGSCEFQVLVNDPKLSELISLRRYEVEIYRREDLTNTRVWAGQQAMRSGTLDSKGLGWVTIRCFTWLELLNMRYTSQNLTYTEIDAGEIAWDLIDRTQRQWVLDNTANNLPGTAADDSATGSLTWSNVNNIKVDDTSSAHVDFGVGGLTHYIKGTNFGFSVPSNANILGIKAEVRVFNDKGLSTDFAKDLYVYLVSPSGIENDEPENNRGLNSDMPTTESTIEYGSATDLWNHPWTVSEVNNSAFGIALAYQGEGSIINIEHVKLTVYYEEPSDDPNGDFGITEGTIEATVNRDRTYENANIMQELIAFTNILAGFDMEITDDKVFNVYSIMGSDKTDEIVLEYGKNIASMRIDEDFVHPVNRAIVLGEAVGQNSLQRVERDDTDSQDDYKIREEVDVESTVSELGTLEEKGDAMLRKYGLPLLKIDIDLVRGCEESIADFGIGDLIFLRVHYGLYDIEEEYRVFEWEVSYSSDNAEKLTLVLGKFTFSGPLFS